MDEFNQKENGKNIFHCGKGKIKKCSGLVLIIILVVLFFGYLIKTDDYSEKEKKFGGTEYFNDDISNWDTHYIKSYVAGKYSTISYRTPKEFKNDYLFNTENVGIVIHDAVFAESEAAICDSSFDRVGGNDLKTQQLEFVIEEENVRVCRYTTMYSKGGRIKVGYFYVFPYEFYVATFNVNFEYPNCDIVKDAYSDKGEHEDFINDCEEVKNFSADKYFQEVVKTFN